jgi:hypothetical protein
VRQTAPDHDRRLVHIIPALAAAAAACLLLPPLLLLIPCIHRPIAVHKPQILTWELQSQGHPRCKNILQRTPSQGYNRIG